MPTKKEKTALSDSWEKVKQVYGFFWRGREKGWGENIDMWREELGVQFTPARTLLTHQEYGLYACIFTLQLRGGMEGGRERGGEQGRKGNREME
jgi:hypothetical protein